MKNPTGNTALYLLQIVISGILMLVLIPVISQHLTPNDFGQFVLAQVYASVAVGIANLGVLLGYERNFFIFEKSNKDSAKLISSAMVFVTFNLVILLVAVYIFQLEISSLILSDNTPNDLLLIVFVGASASSLSQYYLTFLKNSGLAKSYAKYMIVNSVINFIIAIWLITQSSFGVMSLAYAWIISNLILLFSLFLTLRKKLPLSFDKKMLKGVLEISLPLTPRVFFGFMNTQLDKILLGLIGSSSLVGIYHMGQTFALTIFQFMTGLDRVFQPEIYRKLFSDGYIDNSYEINNYILPFFYISMFVALVVALFSREFVSLFFSNEYQGSTPIIIILSIYYGVLFFGKVTGLQLIYAKKTNVTTLLMFLGIMINVGLNIPFIINWGIIGAAWATTISGIFMAIISYFVAQKYVKIAWQWKIVLLIYAILLIAVMFSIIDYHFSLSLYTSLLLKSLLVFSYIVVGYITNLMSIKKIKELIFVKV